MISMMFLDFFFFFGPTISMIFLDFTLMLLLSWSVFRLTADDIFFIDR